MSLPAAASEALQAFAACPGWDQRARLQMILEIGAHAGKIDGKRDAVPFKQSRRADAGELQ